MARPSHDGIDEVALAKERLRLAGEHLDASVRSATKHAALAGVGVSFGAGLLLAAGRPRPVRIARAATLVPRLIAYSKIGKEAFTIGRSLLGQYKQYKHDRHPPAQSPAL